MLNFLIQEQGTFLHFFKSFVFYSSTVKLSSTKSCPFFLKFLLRYFICLFAVGSGGLFLHCICWLFTCRKAIDMQFACSRLSWLQFFTNQYILKQSLIVAVAVWWIKLLYHNSSGFMRIDIIQKGSFQNKTIQYPIGQSITLIPRSIYALLYNQSIKRESFTFLGDQNFIKVLGKPQ